MNDEEYAAETLQRVLDIIEDMQYSILTAEEALERIKGIIHE